MLPTLPANLATNLSDLRLSSVEQRALILLGQGIEPRTVASAVGVTDSHISQLLSNPEFAARVADLRYETLAKHSVRDNAYDELEDTLLEKLKNCIPYMSKPMEILAAVTRINQAKRRGSMVNPSSQSQNPVIQLNMPIQVINQYRLDVNNQVIQAGQQPLITVQSGSLKAMVEAAKALRTKETQNVELLPSPAAATG
jgi:hypothetical protein